MQTSKSIAVNMIIIILLLIIFRGCSDGNFMKDAPGPSGSGGYNIGSFFGNITVKSVTMTTAVCSTMYSSYILPLTDRGFCWSSLHSPTNVDSLINVGLSGNFTATLTDLKAGRKYNVRAFVTKNGQMEYSNVISFTTFSGLPDVTTSFVFDFTVNSALVGGSVLSEGHTNVSDRGIYWDKNPNPEITGTKIPVGKGLGTFSAKITGLNPGTTYYVKAYATNSVGTGYGLKYSFNTGNDTSMPRITDADGNIYHFVTIGSQVWMAENLKTTKYNDGTGIPLVTDNTNWANLKTPGFCWYDNNETEHKSVYGALYNWYSINTGKLCPAGWHVPTEAEWAALKLVPLNKLKEVGSTHWIYANSDANNETGFTALPGGSRNIDGTFNGIGSIGAWWTSTGTDDGFAWRFLIYGGIRNVSDVIYPRSFGNSVRCIKN